MREEWGEEINLIFLKMKINKHYFKRFSILFLIECFIALFIHDNFIRSYVGDFLVVLMLYFLLRTFTPFSPFISACIVLLYSFITEIAQYFQLIYHLKLEHSFLARIILGKTFSWTDMLIYVLAFLTILLYNKRYD